MIDKFILPRNCTYTEHDWKIFASFWHPVIFVNDIPDDKPAKAKLLDQDLAVFRTSQGVTVAKDVCVHRGTPLTLGKIDNNRLVCMYHGFQYDGTGKCVFVPSMGENGRIPARLKLKTYKSVERYGIIWVCLSDDEPLRPLPEWPLLDDKEFGSIYYLPHLDFDCSCTRLIENFCDNAHFGFVHEGTFGNKAGSVVPPLEVVETDDTLCYEMDYVECRRKLGAPEIKGYANVNYVKHLTYPFAVDLKVTDKETGSETHYYNIDSPVSTKKTRGFIIAQTNADYFTEAELIEYELAINMEDKPFVEGQRPEESPLNIGDEVHVPADLFAVRFRRALREKFGIQAKEYIT